MRVGARRAAYELPIEQRLESVELLGHLNPPDTESHRCQNRRWSPEPISSLQALLQQQSQSPPSSAFPTYCITIDVVEEQAGALRPHTYQSQEHKDPGTQAQVYGVEEL